ncbi:MAG: hypothetical protein OEV59_02675 [Deltaproteobacteria bacterium]|nr:hypothetical protein [Deltaproteobacteria bacterium]
MPAPRKTAFYHIALSIIILIVAGCSSTKTKTGLYDQGMHTGTVTLLRVDNPKACPPLTNGVTSDSADKEAAAPAANNPKTAPPSPTAVLPAPSAAAGTDAPELTPPNKETPEQHSQKIQNDVASWLPEDIGRFVKLRHKMDTAGLYCPQNTVTNDDLVTITLDSAFIKYFKEKKSIWPWSSEQKKGEIALVLSFESGNDSRDDILIYGSQGQTSGSFLNAEDWPMIGPITIKGDNLKIRLVMIEIDKVENEETKILIRKIANVATTLKPGTATATAIPLELMDVLLSMNSDDIILDQRFSLKRVPGSDTPSQFATAPLLYGKYVVMLQSDRFTDKNIGEEARVSTSPISINDMRYDTYSSRIFKTYNYLPYPELNYTGTKCETPENQRPPLTNILAGEKKTLYGGIREGNSAITLSTFGVWSKDSAQKSCPMYGIQKSISSQYKCNYTDREIFNGILDNYVNGPEAKREREVKLGYNENVNLGVVDVAQCIVDAVKGIYDDSRRVEPQLSTNTGEDTDSYISGTNGFGEVIKTGDTLYFEYPVIMYPTAYTFLAQYPTHTNIVFTISRSLGGEGTPAHLKLKTSAEEFNKKITDMQATADIEKLKTALTEVHNSYNKERAVLRKLEGQGTVKDKICLLYTELKNKKSTNQDCSIKEGEKLFYNELYHLTGKHFNCQEEITKHIGTICDPKPPTTTSGATSKKSVK